MKSSFFTCASILCATLFLNLALPTVVLAMDDQTIEMGQVGQAAQVAAAPPAAPVAAAVAEPGMVLGNGWVIPLVLYGFIVSVIAIIIPIIIHEKCDDCNQTIVNDTICENTTIANCTEIVRLVWECTQAPLCYVNQTYGNH